MSRSALSQVINSSGKGSNSADKRKKRERAAHRAAKSGPPGLAEKLNPLKSGDWMLERKEKKEDIKKQYFSNKSRLHAKERQAEAVLKSQIARRKREIDTHYKVEKMKSGDPRLDKARRKARNNFTKQEKKMERKHKQQWQQSYRSLRNHRDKQYRDSLKEIKKDYRRQRGLPDKMKTPWKF